MLRNYIKIAWRNLVRHRHFTLINVLGLSVGVAAALLLFMAVRYEFSFDTFHLNGDRIYRIARKQVYSNGNESFTAGTPLPVAAALKTDIPQFEAVVPVYATLRPQVTVLGRTPAIRTNAPKFLEEREGFLAGPEFFQLFHFPWRFGTSASLARPNVVALTERYARKYFGSAEQAIGQYLRINNRFTMQVVGVLADQPKNTNFPLNLVISYETKRRDFTGAFGVTAFTDWGASSSNDQIFVRLSPNLSTTQADALLANFSRRHYDRLNSSDRKTHFLNALADMHHDVRFDGFAPNIVSVPQQRLWSMVAVGALILLMACINFVNISSALATKRAKEVGVRKVLGGQKSQLVAQFLVETVLLVVSAIGLGVWLAYMALPLLEPLFGLPTDPALYFSPDLMLGLLLLLGLLTVLAGLYPALVLSSFSPLAAFRNRVSSGWGHGLSLRQILIVVQFTAALVLLMGTVINLQQMNFLSRMDLGFAKDGIFYFRVDREYNNRNTTLRNELLRIPGVSSVTFFSDLPSSDVKFQSSFAFTNMAKDEDFPVSMKMVDGDYVKTYGIPLVAGASYATNDTVTQFLVNETLLKKLNIRNPASVIGRRLRLGTESPAEIVGVVKDFQTNSAREGGVQPLVILPDKRFFYGGSVKLHSPNLVRTVDQIKATYARTFPEVAFWGKFYDDELNTYYAAERQMGLLYRVFAGLTIFVACLGLFGLATFTAQQRTKEIGVRKVLGASVASIVTLLSRDFLKLVLIAIVLASPIAWYAMHHWLQDFAYKITIEWWVFALAGLLVVGVTLLTVSFQSIRAALVNPVKSLRNE
jgi:predicted permease